MICDWRTVGGLPLEAAILLTLVFTVLVARRCRECEDEMRERTSGACAYVVCPEGREPIVVEDECVCVERSIGD